MGNRLLRSRNELHDGQRVHRGGEVFDLQVTVGGEAVPRVPESERVMPTVKVDSSKEKIGKDLAYPLATSDLVAALESAISADIHLSIRFSSKQAYWQEQRDAVDERGTYRVTKLHYSPSRPQSEFEKDRPWGGGGMGPRLWTQKSPLSRERRFRAGLGFGDRRRSC